METLLLKSQVKRRVARVFYGWWVVAGGFAIQMVVGSLLLHSFGAYFPLLQREFGWSRALLSGAFSLARAESGLLGPIQGWLIERLGPRMVIHVGMAMFGLGFILFSQIHSVWAYYLTFAMMAVGSSMAGFLTVASTVVNWFIRRRGVAMGVAMSGMGIGGLIVPLVALSITTIGWRTTALLSGFIVLLVGVPLAQLMRQRPEQYGYLPDGDTPAPERDSARAPKAPGAPHTGADGGREGSADFTARDALKSRAFWLLSFGHASALLTVGAVQLHLIPHVVDSVGLSVMDASGAVATMTTINILGQVGGGYLGDRINKRLLIVLAMLGHCSALLILANATTLAPVYAFAVLHGLAWGVRGPMMTTIRADYFGSTFFPSIMGYSSLFVMMGMTAGPLFAGFMADIFDGYRLGFMVIAGITGLGSLLFAAAAPPRPPSRLATPARTTTPSRG